MGVEIEEHVSIGVNLRGASGESTPVLRLRPTSTSCRNLRCDQWWRCFECSVHFSIIRKRGAHHVVPPAGLEVYEELDATNVLRLPQLTLFASRLRICLFTHQSLNVI